MIVCATGGLGFDSRASCVYNMYTFTKKYTCIITVNTAMTLQAVLSLGARWRRVSDIQKYK